MTISQKPGLKTKCEDCKRYFAPGRLMKHYYSKHINTSWWKQKALEDD